MVSTTRGFGFGGGSVSKNVTDAVNKTYEELRQALSKAQKNVLRRNLQNLATSAFRVGQALQGCVLGSGNILNIEGRTQLESPKN